MTENELINLIFFSATVIVALSYSYFISSKLPKGVYKLISLLPIFYFFTILPLFLSSALVIAFATLFLTWLANFKLILFAFNQGPLYPPKSLFHFIIFASLPIKIKSNNSFKLNKKSSVKIMFIESILFPIMINLVCNHKESLNPHVLLLIIYCLLMFLVVDFLVLVPNTVIGTVIGIELDPPSNEPYLATSLQDFWGQRWNLTVSNVLRHTIYKPVKSFFLGKEWDSIPAVFTTFTVSGLMHELFFYYMTRVSPTWKMTLFFVLHGICVDVELLVKRWLAGRFELPMVVSRLLTVGFVVVTSFWLFFPPLIKSGTDVKVIEEFKQLVRFVTDMLELMLRME